MECWKRHPNSIIFLLVKNQNSSNRSCTIEYLWLRLKKIISLRLLNSLNPIEKWQETNYRKNSWFKIFYTNNLIALLWSAPKANLKDQILSWSKPVCFRTSCETNEGQQLMSISGNCSSTLWSVLLRSYFYEINHFKWIIK